MKNNGAKKQYLAILVLAMMVFGLTLSNEVFGQNMTQFSINGPAGSGNFGSIVKSLPNGNFVVVDLDYSIPGGAQLVGAVYLINGANGNQISRITGSTANDRIGSSGVHLLANGNFVILSHEWSNGATAAQVGAATFGNMNTGVSGTVSAANSLVGSTAGDGLSLNITLLTNGNYVVRRSNWDNGAIVDAGAATLCRGDIGTSGVVSSSNSLVGTSAGDRVGSGGTALANGNFIIRSPDWDNGATGNVGAVTFWKGNMPTSGTVSTVNSLIGSKPGDMATQSVTALTNGNYVVASRNWDNGSTVNVGAATFGNGNTGVTGTISAANSLIGSTANDLVGISVTTLTNGNYVVNSSPWDNGSVVNAGAATFGNGMTGVTGVVSASNSLVGSHNNDGFVFYIRPLTNGNYVVISSYWDNGTTADVGAVTFGNGTTGVTGLISSANSLIGSTAGDQIGEDNIYPLTNGNYVVCSSLWDNGAVTDAGAATFGNGTTGITGFVSTSNSLHGTTASDHVCRSVTALTNGNYVVRSFTWDNGGTVDAGAVTFGNGNTGVTGAISPSNSLVGSSPSDSVGSITALKNGNYVVGSRNWDNGSTADVGAATFGNGNTGTSGIVSAANSLIGSKVEDNVGFEAHSLPNGYVVNSRNWGNATIPNAGAFTIRNQITGVTGVVSPSNSLVGTKSGDLQSNAIETQNGVMLVSTVWDNGAIVDAGAVTYIDGTTPLTGTLDNKNNTVRGTVSTPNALVPVFDEINNQMIVGKPLENKVTIARVNTAQTQTADFDYDGDGKSDVSVFRPSNGAWYLNQSTGGFTGVTFGQNGDLISPADFDGDGKTDVAVFRPANGAWYYLKSSDNSFVGLIFGQAGDLPRPADFDGDGKADVNVFRPSNGAWYRLNSSNGAFVGQIFGQNGDQPLVADFDGDGKADIAVFRPLAAAVFFWLESSTGQFKATAFGFGTDIPTPGDYDGDGKTDVAVFRPSDGGWYRYDSSTGAFYGTLFGQNGDIPTAADYDGDGKTDVAVFRSGVWYYQNSSNGGFIGFGFGFGTDIPTPAAFQ